MSIFTSIRDRFLPGSGYKRFDFTCQVCGTPSYRCCRAENMTYGKVCFACRWGMHDADEDQQNRNIDAG